MNLRPVKKYKAPTYPEKSVLLENPDLLKTVPIRWKGNIYIGAALTSILAFSLVGCSTSTDEGGSISKSQLNKVAVAPIFENGNGRGSFGCVSVAPPSFLSEEEAFDVIQAEAGKYNIVFERKALDLKGVEIPETKFYLGDGKAIDATRRGDLTLDGYDASKKIGFEFVSREDYEQWQKKQDIRSSVDDFDFLSTAKLLQQGTNGKNGDFNLGIFYNPMTPYEELRELGIEQYDYAEMELKTKELASAELREQVKGFLEWLKAQEII
ncbi:MAG: hypothetical protein APF76_11070 [Desulfitibacter sp. BRH_c19]|nr:MAG: hypothetical protein APF76_11070 [Desulfitibacter sp. BRH_c19]